MNLKAQVVVIDCSTKPPEALILQTNADRGEFWQNITGSVEKNETYLEAAKRELFEETSITFDHLLEIPFINKFYSQYGEDVEEHCFLCKLSSKPEIKLDPREHQDFIWIPLDQVNGGSFHYRSNYQAFLYAKEMLSS